MATKTKKPAAKKTDDEARRVFGHWCEQLADWSRAANDILRRDERLAGFVTLGVKSDVGSAFECLEASLIRARESLGLSYRRDSLGPCPDPLAMLLDRK